jgi:hypothetical protein
MKSDKKPRGYIDDMSKEQRDMVARLKQELSQEFDEVPEMATTWHILRFLRARDFNFEKSKLMLKNYFNFRKQKDYNRIAQIGQTGERAQLMRKYYTSGHYGVDYEGRVVLIERVGGYDPENLFKHFTSEDVEDHLIQIHERLMYIEMPISSKIYNRRIDNTFLIIDLKNVNVMQLFKSKFKSFVQFGTKIAQDYYPELLSKSVFINVPVIFKAIWAIISMWMDKKTVSKFDFESGNGHKTLSKYLNVDLLPVEIGGQNSVKLSEGFGPWKEALAESYQSQSFFPNDRQSEYDYYYTKEERRKMNFKHSLLPSIDELTRSHAFEEDVFKSAPTIGEIKISSFRVSLKRSMELS